MTVHDRLRDLIGDERKRSSQTTAESDRPLERTRWAGAVDAVGGPTLGYLLRTTSYGGSIAISGNAGGTGVSTTVFPFILRGVNVLGIDSVLMPLDKRVALWQRLATDLRPPRLEESIAQEVPLEEAPKALEAIHRGAVRGRTVVRIG